MQAHRYGRYRLHFVSDGVEVQRKEDFPCFLHQGRQGSEVLWGATFRITMDFLERVYGFQMPVLDKSQVVQGRLGSTYMNGSIMANSPQTPRENAEDY
jgi:hypothetical protein